MNEYVGAIEKQTLANTYFRKVLFTAPHSQLVVMCLRPGEEIGDEIHPKVDQFFRIEQGEANFVLNEKTNGGGRARLLRAPRFSPSRSSGTSDLAQAARRRSHLRI